MDDRWIKLGFSNWKKAMDKSAGITLHENSELHVASMSKWANWKQAQQDGNIAEKLELISRADILANRHYLQSVAQAVLVCAVQNIALRGHREGALEDEEAASTGYNCGPGTGGTSLRCCTRSRCTIPWLHSACFMAQRMRDTRTTTSSAKSCPSWPT